MKVRIFQYMALSAATICLAVVAVASACAQEYTSSREVMQDETLRRDFTLQGEYIYETEGTKMGLQLISDGDGKFRCVFYNGGLPGAGWNTGDFRMLGTATMDGENGLKFVIDKVVSQDKDLSESHETPQNIDAVYTMATMRGPNAQQGARPQGDRPRGERAQGDRPRGERPQGDRPQGPRFGGSPFAGRVSLAMKMHGKDATFAKTTRRSETLRAAAPEGAVVIFDGTNVDMFNEGAKINEAQAPIGNTLWSEATAKPFDQKPYTLHVEFMLSYMPKARGQARSNSGVYINESYECQVLDSFGLELANNECGGFYQIKEPAVNMCFPPLTWQTYDFDFTPPKFDGDKKVANARLTVKQNGVVIHDGMELPNATPGRKPEANEPRGVYLQGHGNKVQYRNIWLKYND